MLDLPGFMLLEAVYGAAREVPREPHGWANLCLTIEGGYQEDWGRTRVRCGPASLVFHPPGDVYGARISDEGSRCLTLGIDPVVLLSAAEALPPLGGLQAARRGPPSWLAFQLRQELELGDDLSPASVESVVLTLLAELSERPALEAHRTPPPWLERVKEQVHDEFAGRLTLELLAGTAGVHRVHLAREFRRHFGCTRAREFDRPYSQLDAERLADTVRAVLE